MVIAARRFALPTGETIALAAALAISGLVGAHLFDVVAYQLDDASMSLWFEFYKGISIYGAIVACAVVVFVWGLHRNDRAKLADTAALGMASALVIGRIGCALIHDHPGLPTSSPFGVDFPPSWSEFLHVQAQNGVLRLHDVGLEELFAAIPLAAALWLLAGRVRAGMVAAIGALAYAAIRFGLDFLRLPEVEPRHAGFTAGQWGSIAMVIVALGAMIRLWGRAASRAS